MGGDYRDTVRSTASEDLENLRKHGTSASARAKLFSGKTATKRDNIDIGDEARGRLATIRGKKMSAVPENAEPELTIDSLDTISSSYNPVEEEDVKNIRDSPSKLRRLTMLSRVSKKSPRSLTMKATRHSPRISPTKQAPKLGSESIFTPFKLSLPEPVTNKDVIQESKTDVIQETNKDVNEPKRKSPRKSSRKSPLAVIQEDEEVIAPMEIAPSQKHEETIDDLIRESDETSVPPVETKKSPVKTMKRLRRKQKPAEKLEEEPAEEPERQKTPLDEDDTVYRVCAPNGTCSRGTLGKIFKNLGYYIGLSGGSTRKSQRRNARKTQRKQRRRQTRRRQ